MLHRILLPTLLVIIAGMVLAASAWDAPGYKDAGAHNPCFADKALWPNLTEKEAFFIQEWPKTRLVVWNVNGGGWIGGGPNKDTDILLPASPKPYEVRLTGQQQYRHVTIEHNAFFRNGDGIGRQIFGNIWVKRGGRMYAQGSTALLGGTNTFFRNDNDESMNTPEAHYTRFSQYFDFAKTGEHSVEVLGHLTMLDEFSVTDGMLIVGADSKVQPERNALPYVKNGAKIVLLDGAYFGLWSNNLDTRDLEVTGTIQGGLPDRPLTRNATVGLNFKNWTKTPFPTDNPSFTEIIAKDKKIRSFVTTRVAGLILLPGSTLRSYSTDLDKARLVFTWSGNNFAKFRPEADPVKDKASIEKSPITGALYTWFDAIPIAVDIYFSTNTMVDGVEFDTFHAGGLLLADPSLLDGWKNVFYGPRNLVKNPAELVKHIEKIGRNGEY